MAYSVLVVDDDHDDLLLLAGHLERCQQEVSLIHAQNGLEATQKLQEGLQPNLILMDVQMPLMDDGRLRVAGLADELPRLAAHSCCHLDRCHLAQ